MAEENNYFENNDQIEIENVFAFEHDSIDTSNMKGDDSEPIVTFNPSIKNLFCKILGFND